jgi:uncharacterized protein with NAD-binding domain and iron-sulfur cluster
LSGTPFDWALCTGGRGADLRLIAVATGRADVLAADEARLIAQAAELRALFGPAVAQTAVAAATVRREPAAFLTVRPGVSALRPLQQSPFANLLLAGDWTDTGLPATLESAVSSAQRCAQAIDQR